MKKLILTIFITFLLTSCTNYFSDYRTVYRIESTTGDRYYSNTQPNFNESVGTYKIEDLDGNAYHLDKDRIYKIEKFKHRK